MKTLDDVKSKIDTIDPGEFKFDIRVRDYFGLEFTSTAKEWKVVDSLRNSEDIIEYCLGFSLIRSSGKDGFHVNKTDSMLKFKRQMKDNCLELYTQTYNGKSAKDTKLFKTLRSWGINNIDDAALDAMIQVLSYYHSNEGSTTASKNTFALLCGIINKYNR